MIIGLDDAASVGCIDHAPVEVEVTTDLANDVLAVPVTALVATPDGYAVDRVNSDGSTERVRVEVGPFGDGWVEVRADLEHDEVVVPS